MYIKCIKPFEVERLDSCCPAGQYEYEIIQPNSFWSGDYNEKDNRFRFYDGAKRLRIDEETLHECFEIITP